MSSQTWCTARTKSNGKCFNRTYVLLAGLPVCKLHYDVIGRSYARASKRTLEGHEGGTDGD